MDVVKLAQSDLKVSRMGYIVGRAPEKVAYIRRYKMKDGSTWTCSPINDSLAHKYKELHESGHDEEIPYTAMELTTVVAEALRICRLENGPETFYFILPECR